MTNIVGYDSSLGTMTHQPTRTDVAVPSSLLRYCSIHPCLPRPVPVLPSSVSLGFSRACSRPDSVLYSVDCVPAHLRFLHKSVALCSCALLPRHFTNLVSVLLQLSSLPFESLDLFNLTRTSSPTSNVLSSRSRPTSFLPPYASLTFALTCSCSVYRFMCVTTLQPRLV